MTNTSNTITIEAVRNAIITATDTNEPKSRPINPSNENPNTTSLPIGDGLDDGIKSLEQAIAKKGKEGAKALLSQYVLQEQITYPNYTIETAQRELNELLDGNSQAKLLLTDIVGALKTAPTRAR